MAFVMDASFCKAKAFNGKDRVYKQCGHKRVLGSEWCTRHLQSGAGHGVWDGKQEAGVAMQPDAVPAVPKAKAKTKPSRPALRKAMAKMLNSADPAPVPQPPVPQLLALACLLNGDEPPLALLDIPWAEYVEVGYHPSAQPKSKPARPVQNDFAEAPPAKFARIRDLASPKKEAGDQINLFIDFCERNWYELTKLPNIGNAVVLGTGKVFLSEVAVAAFLGEYLETQPLKTVQSKFCNLKAGLRSLSLPENQLPAWAAARTQSPPLIHALWTDEKKSTFKSEEAATEQGFVLLEHILAWATHLILKDKEGQCSEQEIFGALFLWTMAGRSHRLTNIQDLQFEQTGTVPNFGQDQPYMELGATKILHTLSATQLGEKKVLVRLYLGDVVSQYLWEAVLQIVGEEQEKPESYVFPYHGPNGFDYSKPMSNAQVKKAVLSCATYNGLVLNEEHAKTFGVNAVRRGLAAEVARLVQEKLHELNNQRGRGSSSDTDLVVYCPRTILVKPGLLHMNTEHIEDYFNTQLSQRFAALKGELLCVVCGYPSQTDHKCSCPKCVVDAAGGRGVGAGSKHTCWLKNRKVGKKSKNEAPETQQEFNERWNAWARFGLNPPLFREGRFHFD